MSLEFLLRQKGDTQNPQLSGLFGEGSTHGLPTYRKIYSGSGINAVWAYINLISWGGRWGCDGLNRVYCNGGPILEHNTAGNAQWIFHPGLRSTGWDDPVQGRPHFFPELDDTFSGKTYVEGLMPPGVDDPSKMEFFVRGLRVMEYELSSAGNLREMEVGFHSRNPSMSGIYLLNEVGRVPLSQINRWAETWIDFKTISSQTLHWDKGLEPEGWVTPPAWVRYVDVPRYDCHVPFSTNMDVTTAFESLMLRCPGASWQFVHGGIKILPTPNRPGIKDLVYDPTQRIILSNIVKGSFSGSPAAVDRLPNFFIYQYHDYEDEAYEVKTVFIDRQELRDATGGIPVVVGPINLGLMYESQCQRIGNCQVRLLVDKPFTTVYAADGKYDSYTVAKADNINLVHKQLGRTLDNPVLARIVKETCGAPKGERKFNARLTTMDYYRDTDHTVKQGGDLPNTIGDILDLEGDVFK